MYKRQVLQFAEDTNNNVDIVVDEISLVMKETEGMEVTRDTMQNINNENKSNMSKIMAVMNDIKGSTEESANIIYQLIQKDVYKRQESMRLKRNLVKG